jgi:osmotically-inducible protein OsmY
MQKHLLKLGLALLLACGLAVAQSSTPYGSATPSTTPQAQTTPPSQTTTDTTTTKHKEHKDKDKTAMSASSSDDSLRSQIQQQLSGNPAFANVQVSVENGVVTLSGTVAKKEDRKQAKDMVKAITGVRKVKDEGITINASAASVVNAPAGASTSAVAASAPVASPADTTASASTSVASSAPITSATPATTEPPSTAGSIVGNTTAASGVQTGSAPATLPQSDQPAAAASTSTTSSASASQTPMSASSGTADLQTSISNAIKNEPTLSGASISVNVTDASIELSGTVANDKQRQTANSLAQSFAQNRKVVDKLTVSKGSSGTAPSTPPPASGAKPPQR